MPMAAAGSSARPGASTVGNGRRPQSAKSETKRLTVTKYGTEAANPRGAWPSADDEKKRLYDQAREKVERVQGNAVRGIVRLHSFSGDSANIYTVPRTSVSTTNTISTFSLSALAVSGRRKDASV